MKKIDGESPNRKVGQKKLGQPSIQWEEISVDLTPKGNNEPWGAFQPRPPSERHCMHAKTNECDY